MWHFYRSPTLKKGKNALLRGAMRVSAHYTVPVIHGAKLIINCADFCKQICMICLPVNKV